MKSAWIVRFLVLAALLFFFVPTAAAESIRSFEGKIAVKTDGTVRVEERILYDFGGMDRHGIYRDIETIKTNAKGERFVLGISDISVVDAQGQVQSYTSSHKRSDDSDRLSLRIGDPNRTVSGRHLYVIRYTVSGALTYFSDHDELYWNLTGNDWEVPIEHVSGQVSIPDGEAGMQMNTRCYTGSKGSTEANCTITTAASTTTLVADGLGVREGVTAVVGFPKGIVAVVEPTAYVAPKPSIWLMFLTILGVIFGIWWYIVLPVQIVYKWYRAGRDPKVAGDGVVSAAFDPPKLKNGQVLTPAETGTLIDEQVHARDIVAAIVDLARRGYLRIEERKKKDWWLVQVDRLKADIPLQPHESIILDKLFGGQREVQLSKTDLSDMHRLATTSLNESMVLRGFFAKRPDKIRNPYYVLSFVAMFTMNIVLALVAAFAGRAMPQKSAIGVVAANHAKSLKKFLGSQQRQLEYQAMNQMMFEKLLPYAVAFGVEKVWAKRMEGIPFQQPSWYAPYSSGNLNAAVFTNSLSQSMSKVTSSMTPTSSSSGFSSGFSGGSSGGGGGGGGGGSW